MKCITGPSPKVALERSFFFWKLCCFAFIVYRTFLDADRHLSPYDFESRAFGRVLIFLLHHLVDFKPEEFSVPFLPCLCGGIVTECKKMTSKATLVIVHSGFSSWWLQFTCQGPLKPSSIFLMLWRKKKSKFLRVWNAFPGNWQQSSSQVYDLDSNLDFPYAFLTLWKMSWLWYNMHDMPPNVFVLLSIECLQVCW